MADIKVITDALKAEAGKWDGLAEQTKSPRDYAKSATLAPTAFLLVDPTGLAPVLTWDQAVSSIAEQQSYDAIRELAGRLLDGAVAEFGQIADALIEIAAAYEEADRVIDDRFTEFYTA